jgi:hypothetical protein
MLFRLLWRVAVLGIMLSIHQTYIRRSEVQRMTLVGTPIALWTGERGLPKCFVWEGKRFPSDRYSHAAGV